MTEYVVAKYIRLSVDEAVTDSLSIPNQRRMLDRYIDELEIPGVSTLEFVDNGYTGTNFERPSIQELLALVRSGRIDCILCKDFSRFGRNAIETGYFIEQVFPLYQTRFISVDDHFDSDDYKETTGGLDIGFKHIAHEQYSRDLSLKVKSAKRIQMMRGENIVANAIYGYRKGDSGRWKPDGEAAEVVRDIYAMALENRSPAQIRDRLFARGIPTPREYQSMKRGADLTPSCMWTARMVTHMLANEQYTGMYVAGKQVSKAIGSHSKIHTAKSEWIMIPDRHPAIIDKETFQTVQSMTEKYRRGKVVRKPRKYLLRGKVACGCCCYALSYDAISDPVFRCHHTQADPSAKCHKMKVNVRELDEAVLAMIEKQLQVVLNRGITEIRRVDDREQRIADYEDQIRECVEQRQQIYEQFVLQQIDRDTYMVRKDLCGKRLDKLSQQCSILKAEMQKDLAAQTMASQVRKLVDQSTSPRELVETLVEKIYVSPGNRVEVEWRIVNFTERI